MLDDYCILNEDGLCYKDELVKYKMFDFIGDFFMCGYNILGDFRVYKLGYGVNNKLFCVVFVNENVWEFVIFEDKEIVL